MGPFETQVENMSKADEPVEEGKNVVVQRTSENGYGLHGWNQTGKVFSALANSSKNAGTIKRAVEVGLR
jgi:hypothetical protein